MSLSLSIIKIVMPPNIARIFHDDIINTNLEN